MEGFGERIRQLRQERGVQQKWLAEKLEITQASLSDMEKNEYPPLIRIYQICKIFNMELWEFFIDNPAAIKKFMPSWMTEDDLEMIKVIRTRYNKEEQAIIFNMFKETLQSFIRMNKARRSSVINE